MFNIYISQRGLDSLACGITIGAIMYDNESDVKYRQAKNILVNSFKADTFIATIGGNYTSVYDYVPFGYDDLELMRRIRYQCENLVLNLINKLGIQLKDCKLILDSSLPKLSFGIITIAKSIKTYPMIHMTRLLVESNRRRRIESFNIIYPQYKFKFTQGRISPNHISVLIKHGVSKLHRPNTPEFLTDYLIDLYHSNSSRKKEYIFFLKKTLPFWWRKYYLTHKNIVIHNLLDLIPSDKRQKPIICYKTDTGHLTRTNSFTPIKHDDYKWFEQHAPYDLKYELLL